MGRWSSPSLKGSSLSSSTSDGSGLPSPDVPSTQVSRLSLLSRLGTPKFRRRTKPAVSAQELQSTTPGTAQHLYGKGPFGLTTLSQPVNTDQTNAHIVFVHGLGGGSEHTWMKDGILWPRDLLPGQEPFQDAGIHTFGYDSNFKKTSTLNINDFSKSLLNSLLNSPSIGTSTVRVSLCSSGRMFDGAS